MKKLLLFSLSAILAFSGYAQKHIPTPKNLREVAIKMQYRPAQQAQAKFTNEVHNSDYVKSVAIDESQIGITQYDLQTNASLGNRLWLFEDGTVGGVWTRGVENAPAFPDRGTGYNYFDGAAWGEGIGPIESVRAGWPSYAAFGENGEIVVAHDFSAGKLLFNSREVKGTGDWTESLFEGPGVMISWARMVTSGTDHQTIQNICITNGEYEGQTNALLYSRSTDGGESWEIENTILDGTGSDYYSGITADDYTWAEPRAGVIAFVVSNTWTSDWFIMKSEDEGDTWQKIMVWEHPYPFYDWDVTVFSDTLWAPDGSADVAIDNNGKVHTVSGLCRVLHEEVGNNYFLYPYAEGIVYWNEDMPEFTDDNPHHALSVWDEVLTPDVNLIGWGQDLDNSGDYSLLDEIQYYRTIGLQTMPNITIGNDNQIFVVWAGTTEGFDNGTVNFKHIWTRRSPDSGPTWGYFYDLDGDLVHIFDECIYPVLAGSTDESLHLLYQLDSEVGTALDEDHGYHDNTMTYVNIPIDPTYVGIEDMLTENLMEVSQNFPNPFSETTLIRVDLAKRSTLSLEITNFMGQKVREIDAGTVNQGPYNFSLDADKLSPGVYFYTIKAGDQKTSRKMIVD
ncbi:MAG: T9SS type A sorting domain-containing protein [Chlorobi bacterium]|nr:T9SS type A sorting domain-containing protein [Chlorobiota bacterium]